MNLPFFLKDFLKKNDFEFEYLIQFNSKKFTYVLKVKKNNNYYILKAFDKKRTPFEIREKFFIEKKFYEENKSLQQIPKLIYSQFNILILEYIEGISLREYLIRESNKTKILLELIRNIEMFRDNIYTNYKENKRNFENVFRYIYVLGNSHPFQVKDIKIDIFNKILNKVITKMLIFKSKKILRNIDTQHLKKGFSHNDFHYNNILISANNSIKIIDFENIKYEGFFEFDILFLIVLIEIYLNNEDKKIIDNYLNSIFKNIDLKEVYTIFRIALSLNKKFYLFSDKKYLNTFEKVVLFFKLLKDFKEYK